MAIHLMCVENGARATKQFARDVVHLGRRLPEGKQGVAVAGEQGIALVAEQIADHHGKIYYAYDSYRYVNLTALPTRVFRGAAFSFELDPWMPQCEVFEGDRLQLGTAMVEIARLSPPPSPLRAWRKKQARGGRAVTEALACEHLNCQRCDPSVALGVVRTTGELRYRLREYTRPHEILRAAVDWLVELFQKGAEGDCRLRLGAPRAAAIRPLPGAPPIWENFQVPVKRGVIRPELVACSLSPSAVARERFVAGFPFRFRGAGRRISGIATGILEEGCYEHGIPRAGHYALIQYPAGKVPGADDLCVLHHVATGISEVLDGIQVASLRHQREVEREGGMESEGLFHDMEGICSGAMGAVAVAKAGPGRGVASVRSHLADAQVALEDLMLHIQRGRRAFEADEESPPGWVDLHKVCQEALQCVFGDSVALRKRRHWTVQDLSDGNPPLRPVACDRFALERVLQNLVRNADRAAAKRGSADFLVKRVHLLLDMVKKDRLDFARIRVADDGSGLPPEAFRVIFDGRFSTKKGGHGLGTQVAANLVRRHFGFIEVASSQGKGTVIGILLPAPPPHKGDTLANTAHWLAPYQECSVRDPLVSRTDLNSLIENDPALRHWYQQQGRDTHA